MVPAAPKQAQSAAGEGARPRTSRPRVSGPPVKADIEQLLPLSPEVKSLPRPPRLPNLEPLGAQPATRRFPWTSLTVFTAMLGASAITLSRYSDVNAVSKHPAADVALAPVQAPAAHEPASMKLRESERDTVDRIVARSWAEPTRMRAALLDEGERALANRDERLAEALFARAQELPASDGRPEYGLARVRFAQHDLEGAEGWLQAAIGRASEVAEYHSLYARVLEQRGRSAQAEAERARARSRTNARPSSR